MNGLTFINTMGNVLVAFENAPTLDVYYYIKINGEVSGTATYLSTFSGSVQVPTGGYDNDFMTLWTKVNEWVIITLFLNLFGNANPKIFSCN
jgi:hypothetical protein